MSQENVEVVRRAWEAFARRDNEAAFALYDAEIEIDSPADGRVYRGLDGVREFFRDWLAAWDQYRSAVEEWTDADDDVIAAQHEWGTGKHSGAAVENRSWHVWSVRDGKLWRLRVYTTKAGALEAVGLSE